MGAVVVLAVVGLYALTGRFRLHEVIAERSRERAEGEQRRIRANSQPSKLVVYLVSAGAVAGIFHNILPDIVIAFLSGGVLTVFFLLATFLVMLWRKGLA